MRFVRCPAFSSCLGHASGFHRPLGRSADRKVQTGRLLASHDSNGGLDERELPEQLQGETNFFYETLASSGNVSAVSPESREIEVFRTHCETQRQRERFHSCLSMLYDASQSSVHSDIESPTASCKNQSQACG